MKIHRKRFRWKKCFIGILVVGIVCGCYVFGVNALMKNAVSDRILSEQEAIQQEADCILVLGAGVREDGTPSPLLKERLEQGILLYKNGASPKLLMSGDHGRAGYDEVNKMKEYALEAGISGQDVFMDHAGFSTYDSIYRVKNVFQAKKIIIVTQKYHLYRALYLAEQFGLDAYGVAADQTVYNGQFYREIREIMARNKDFIKAWFQPSSKYVGDAIPVNGDGNLTNDK